MKLKTYCLACREHTNNIGSKTVTMRTKVIRENQDVLNVCLINRGL